MKKHSEPKDVLKEGCVSHCKRMCNDIESIFCMLSRKKIIKLCVHYMCFFKKNQNKTKAYHENKLFQFAHIFNKYLNKYKF